MANKNKLIVALGFGVGGALWGLEAYRGTVGSDEVFTNPFSYILGSVALAICGGIALAYIKSLTLLPSRLSYPKRGGAREGVKIIGLGLIGWVVAFALPAVWAYELFLFGSVFTPFLVGILVIPAETMGLNGVINPILNPSFMVGNFWLEFLITGVIIGLIYALVMKTKILKAVLYSAGGFALASLLGPILGNLIGNIFGSLFISYISTFTIIGVVFGFFLGAGVFSRGKIEVT